MSVFRDRMHPDDPGFENWARNLLDQDDEDIIFPESDNELEDSPVIEEIYEEDSDADYVPDENEIEDLPDERKETDDLPHQRERFYIGKNKFKW